MKIKNSLVRSCRAWAGVCLVALTGSVVAEDLAQVYQRAKDSDPKYRAALYEMQAIAYVEPQAMAFLLPTISLEYTQMQTRQDILSSVNTVYGVGASSFGTTNNTLSLTQPLFKLSAWRGYKQAKTKVKQAAANFGAVEQDLMLRVASTYLNVLAAQDMLGFNKAERDAIKRQLDLVQQRFKSGLVTRVVLYEAQARYTLKEADVVAAQNDLDDKLQAMREMTGVALSDVKGLPDNIPLEQPDPPELERWLQSAVDQNLMLQARRLTVDVAEQEIGRQSANHWPTLDLLLNQNEKNTGGSLFGGGSNIATSDVSVRLTVPIYSGGATSALTGEASKRYLAAQEDLERDLRQVDRQTRAAFQSVTGGIVRVNALGQGVVSSSSLRELRVAGLNAGLETIVQVLDAERDLYAVKRDAARARYDYLLNRMTLKRAVGTLNESDLLTVNGLMN